MIAPKLRFSEFKDEWFEKKLEEIATVERGKFSPRPRNDPKFYNGEMPFIQTGDVANCGIYLEKYTQTLNEEGIKVSKVFPKNSILITIAANIGDTAITRFPVACPDSLVAIQPLENIANTHFLNNLLELKKEYLDSQATQNAQKNINLQVLKPLELVIPNYQEQTKIAEFLSAVDDKISQLSRQLELLNQYKKGVMQKIFSQKIRFNGFNDEWEGRKIGDFITKYVGGASFTPSDFVKKSNFEVIPKKAITARGLLRLDALNPTFSSGEFYQQNQNYTVDKTYLITTLRDLVPSGPNIGYIVSFENEKKYILAQGVYGFQTKNINRQFLIQYSNTDKFRKIMQSKLVGSTQVHIRNQDYFDTEILVPSIPEQEKIAEFLTAIDERIDHITAQLTHTKQWKKGLLQQMFV